MIKFRREVHLFDCLLAIEATRTRRASHLARSTHTHKRLFGVVERVCVCV